ncbi:hypothetical protein FK220_003565 [Flavobacteriaceae bacterium TP-CH-4]|uniref:Lipocalin-like domain-containing protein n=1 Tax=Pelagihabitans pacificus TaxID=2696054 RepID=A0A967AR09_9FLAO|nr:lipocalin family protein [Pelagihabitans pacificus]NHF58402.1 hypothetical protein [Pelagihabitans pacificus]
MKYLFTLLLSVSLLVSCSSDEDETGTPSIVGEWDATSFTTSLSFDLNGDGQSSNDIIQELDCYTSTLTFNEDGTFTSFTSDITLEPVGDGTFLGDCEVAPTVSGTYTLSNAALTTVTGDQTIESQVQIGNTEMILRGQDQDFGSLTIIYERQ